MTDRVSRRFRSEPGEAAAARRFAAEVVDGWGQRCGDLDLVVGELAANALVHGDGPFRLSLALQDGDVVVEVADGAIGMPTRQHPRPEDNSGRGLVIVDRVSNSWGARPDRAGGKVVWAKLPAS